MAICIIITSAAAISNSAIAWLKEEDERRIQTIWPDSNLPLTYFSDGL